MQPVWVLSIEIPYEGSYPYVAFTSEDALVAYTDTYDPPAGGYWLSTEMEVW